MGSNVLKFRGTVLSERVLSRYLTADTEDDDEDLFDQWMHEVNQDGKRKIPNPNPATKDQYPEVSVSTAMQNSAYLQRMMEDFKRWKGDLNKKSEPPKKEKAPPKKESKPVSSKPAVQISDDDVDAMLKKHKAYFDSLETSMSEKVADLSKHISKHIPKARFELMSDGEKKMFAAGHEVGKYFVENVLTDKTTHETLMNGWRAASGDPRAQQLHGMLDSMGVQGHAPEGELDEKDLKAAYKKGPSNKKLQAYVKEVLTFNRAVFKKLGMDHLTVYRDVDGQGLDEVKNGTKVHMECRQASSFTFDPTLAGTFGKHTVKYEVPVSQVFSSPFTYPAFGSPLYKKAINESGAFGESEVIVMGASALEGERVR